MRIGLFGGSFNPIHNGHITLGKTMLKAMNLDEVWYVISPQNPLKKQSNDLANEEDRLRLARMALQDEPQLIASDVEFSMPRPSYTWNTLQNLKEEYPQHTFVLIIGGDNWDKFHQWAHHEEILKNYEIAVFPRNPVLAEGINTTGEAPHPTHPNVTIINVPKVDITSTMLREMLKRGEDITPFVPKKVAEELRNSRLYR